MFKHSNEYAMELPKERRKKNAFEKHRQNEQPPNHFELKIINYGSLLLLLHFNLFFLFFLEFFSVYFNVKKCAQARAHCVASLNVFSMEIKICFFHLHLLFLRRTQLTDWHIFLLCILNMIFFDSFILSLKNVLFDFVVLSFFAGFWAENKHQLQCAWKIAKSTM